MSGGHGLKEPKYVKAHSFVAAKHENWIIWVSLGPEQKSVVYNEINWSSNSTKNLQSHLRTMMGRFGTRICCCDWSWFCQPQVSKRTVDKFTRKEQMQNHLTLKKYRKLHYIMSCISLYYRGQNLKRDLSSPCIPSLKLHDHHTCHPIMWQHQTLHERLPTSEKH